MFQNNDQYLYDVEGNKIIELFGEVLVKRMHFYEKTYYENFKQYMKLEVFPYTPDDTKLTLESILKKTGVWPDFDDSKMQVNIKRSTPFSHFEFYTVLYRYFHEAGIIYIQGQNHPFDEYLQNTPFISLGKYGRVIKTEPKIQSNLFIGTLFDNPLITDSFPLIERYCFLYPPIQDYLTLLPETIELEVTKASVIASPTERFNQWFDMLLQGEKVEMRDNFYFRKENENTVIMDRENIGRIKIEKINEGFKLSEDYPREYKKKYGSSRCFTKMMCVLENYFMNLDTKHQLNHNLQHEKSSLDLAHGMK